MQYRLCPSRKAVFRNTLGTVHINEGTTVEMFLCYSITTQVRLIVDLYIHSEAMLLFVTNFYGNNHGGVLWDSSCHLVNHLCFISGSHVCGLHH